MKQYTIAEILHYAADKKLASKESEYWVKGGNKERFSCCAVEETIYNLYNEDDREELISRVSDGLKAMGCPTGSFDAFEKDNNFNAENQQTRYAWLKFAAIMAEEQGV